MSGRRGRNPFGAGTVFQCVFYIQVNGLESQSLWSRDGFSIIPFLFGDSYEHVAIPLEQGRFFNLRHYTALNPLTVAIPLEQGRFFNALLLERSPRQKGRNPFGAGTVFQSIRESKLRPAASRNPFGAGTVFQYSIASSAAGFYVAIPLEQGRFFNSEVCFSFLFLGY